MDTTQSPEELQSQILQGWAKQPEPKPEPEPLISRDEEKFFKAFGESFDDRLKDNAYYQLIVEQSSISTTSLHRFAEGGSETVPLSLLCESITKCVGMMRYEAKAATFITRLFLGGDIETASEPKSDPYSVCEIGIQNVFARWIAKSLRLHVETEFPHVQTTFPTEIDLTEIQDHPALVCTYFIIYGENRCRFDLALSTKLIAQEQDDEATQPFKEHLEKADEVSNSPLQGSVHLSAVATTLNQIKNLRIGDCLPLSESGGLTGKFTVNGKGIYEGEIGRSAGRYSFKVSRTVQTTDQ